MTDDYRVTNGNDYVVLKKCDTNEKQSWECAGDDKKYIHRHEKQTRRYMDYGEFYDYVTVNKAWPSVAQWRRYGTQKDVCSQGNLKNRYAMRTCIRALTVRRLEMCMSTNNRIIVIVSQNDLCVYHIYVF